MSERLKEIDDAIERLGDIAAEAGFYGFNCDWVHERAKELDAERAKLVAAEKDPRHD